MKYEMRNVYIVKGVHDGTIHKVCGLLGDAEAVRNIDATKLVIDVWPCVFEYYDKDTKVVEE